MTFVQAVQKKYGEIAAAVKSGGSSCCGPSCCSTEDPITGNLYKKDQTAGLPKEAVDASLGCGNPTALIDLQRRRRPFSTSAPVEASMCCCPLAVSARPARSTGSI